MGTFATEPRVRASWSQFALGRVRAYPEPWRARLLGAIGHEMRAHLRQLGLVGWAPAALHMKLCETIAEQLGQQRALDFWRDYYMAAFDLSLLKPLVAAARRLYGDDPHSYIRQAPYVYGLVTRQAGTLQVTRVGEGVARVDATGLAPIFRGSDALVDSLAGTCVACVYHAKRRTPVLRRDYTALAEGRSTFEVEW